MDFDEIKDKLVLKTLHTSYNYGKGGKSIDTIFYRKPFNANNLIIILEGDVNNNFDVYSVSFDLDDVELLSLNKEHGLLVQSKGELFPFEYKDLVNVKVI